MFHKYLLAAAVSTVGAVSAQAATVSIDSFDTTNFQVVGAPSLGAMPLNPITTSGPTADAIGGVRTITAERTSPAGTDDAFGAQVQSVVTDGFATVSLGANVEGFSIFSWDAGNTDMVSGSNDAFVLDVLSFDLQGVMMTFTAGGASVTQTVTDVGEVAFNFSDFAGADLTDVGAMSLMIAGPASFDLTFDSVRAQALEVSEVPLPAAGFMILAGLGALGALRKGRNT